MLYFLKKLSNIVKVDEREAHERMPQISIMGESISMGDGYGGE